MSLINRFVFLFISYIMYGCTYETTELEKESTMLAPEITYGWSQSGKVTPGSQFSAVTAQAQFEEPGNYTVQFNIEDPNSGLGNNNRVLLRAEVIWKVQGNQIRRVVDCADGVSITGTAEAVQVKVYDDSSLPTPQTLQDVAVSILIAKGTRASVEKPPTYFLEEITVGAGAGDVVAIPNDIGAISVFAAIRPETVGTPIDAYDVLISQSTAAAGGVVMGYDPRQTDFVPLAAGAKRLIIETAGGSPVMNISLILGVDG